MKCKHLCLGLLIFSLIFGYSFESQAQGEGGRFLLYINGQELAGQETFIQDDRTYVPLRKVTEYLGFTVEYKEKNRDILIKNEKSLLKMNVKSKTFTKDGIKKEMDVYPILKNDRTYVPIRFVAEAYDLRVDWDAKNHVAIVGTYPLLNNKEGSPRLYPEIGLKLYLGKDFDKEIKTEYIEKWNQYNFFDKHDQFLGTLSCSDGPLSGVVPGYLLQYKDGYFTEVTFASDVPFTKETKDDYSKALDLLKKSFSTVELIPVKPAQSPLRALYNKKVDKYGLYEDAIFVSPIEWIAEDQMDRIKELGINVANDMPNGYYMYQENPKLNGYFLNDKTIYKVAKEEDIAGERISVSKEEFFKRMESFEPGIVLLELTSSNGELLEVTEVYLP